MKLPVILHRFYLIIEWFRDLLLDSPHHSSFLNQTKGLTTEYRATFPTILIEVARWLGSRFQGIIQMARWLVSRFQGILFKWLIGSAVDSQGILFKWLVGH